MAKDEPQKVDKPAEGAKTAQPADKTADNIEPASRVTDAPGGARRGGFFKRRDYS